MKAIRPDAIRAHMRFLSDSLLRGRAPGTPGYEVAARYVAAQLEAAGLHPAGILGRDQSQHRTGESDVPEGGAVAQDYDLAGVSVYWRLCLQSKYCFCSSLLRTLKSLWS